MADWSQLSTVITDAEATGARLGVSVITPSGARFSHNGAQCFVAASTVKIAIMIELFRQIDAGLLSLDQLRPTTEADTTTGSGVIMHLHFGLEFTLGDLAYLMMSISDNSATNMLIEAVGMAKVNATMRSLGMAHSALNRLMRGRPMLQGESENLTVCDEYAVLIQDLLAGTVASAPSCEKMVALLEKQQNDRRIARFLPHENRPRWGSKTGSLPGVVNDIGFIMTPTGPLCLAVCVEKLVDVLEGEVMIGRVARAALAVG